MRASRGMFSTETSAVSGRPASTKPVVQKRTTTAKASTVAAPTEKKPAAPKRASSISSSSSSSTANSPKFGRLPRSKFAVSAVKRSLTAGPSRTLKTSKPAKALVTKGKTFASSTQSHHLPQNIEYTMAPADEEFNNESIMDILTSTRADELDERQAARRATTFMDRSKPQRVSIAPRRTTIFLSSRDDNQAKRASIYAGAVRIAKKKPMEESHIDNIDAGRPSEAPLSKLQRGMDEYFARLAQQGKTPSAAGRLATLGTAAGAPTPARILQQNLARKVGLAVMEVTGMTPKPASRASVYGGMMLWPNGDDSEETESQNLTSANAPAAADVDKRDVVNMFDESRKENQPSREQQQQRRVYSSLHMNVKTIQHMEDPNLFHVQSASANLTSGGQESSASTHQELKSTVVGQLGDSSLPTESTTSVDNAVRPPQLPAFTESAPMVFKPPQLPVGRPILPNPFDVLGIVPSSTETSSTTASSVLNGVDLPTNAVLRGETCTGSASALESQPDAKAIPNPAPAPSNDGNPHRFYDALASSPSCATELVDDFREQISKLWDSNPMSTTTTTVTTQSSSLPSFAGDNVVMDTAFAASSITGHHSTAEVGSIGTSNRTNLTLMPSAIATASTTVDPLWTCAPFVQEEEERRSGHNNGQRNNQGEVKLEEELPDNLDILADLEQRLLKEIRAMEISSGSGF
ncbi:hypothetical protein HK102_001723 [Quaeritorhiza haematococci]|nr:hypothetical protein HK102_001723 [Quaeritorhiza haematococci]